LKLRRLASPPEIGNKLATGLRTKPGGRDGTYDNQIAQLSPTAPLKTSGFKCSNIKTTNVLIGFTSQQFAVKSSRSIHKETKMRERERERERDVT